MVLPKNSLPLSLHARLDRLEERWLKNASPDQQQQLVDWLAVEAPDRTEQLMRVWVGSDYVAAYAAEWPDRFLSWLQTGWYGRQLTRTDIADLLNAALVPAADDPKKFDLALRQFRRDFMMRVLWRDFCRLAETQETTREMTYLAEIVTQAAIDFHQRLLEPRFGTPIGRRSGIRQPFIVLGMGKLGGYELNVSSDIDLIFSYPEAGDTSGGRKSVSNQEFFLKLSQKVIASLDATSPQGFVFRVDMRLRPYGQSGAMVLNFDAMEDYYHTQGRDWERYAMIKARVIAHSQAPGAAEAAQKLLDMLHLFTYRRYLDFSAFESMRTMKELIQREVKRRRLANDVKLGAGGIREIEFIVQVFQLIRGGRDLRLREPAVLTLLPLLEAEGHLDAGDADKLATAYKFLRDSEHAIQGYKDRQTQALPEEPEEQSRLAWIMGFVDWTTYLAQLDIHRQFVHECFLDVIAPRDTSEAEEGSDWSLVFPLEQRPEQSVDRSLLKELGLAEPQEMGEQLDALLKNRAIVSMEAVARKSFVSFMGALMDHFAQQQESAETLRRILGLVEAVARRSAYFVLLLENRQALSRLVELCAASVWISEQLASHPALLDELLDPRELFAPPDKDGLRDELRQATLRIPADDVEAQMENLRYFRRAHALRVAASEVTGVLPLMKVSDYLTWLAEVILEQALELARAQMRQRHGEPGLGPGGEEPKFIVVGYGKLGGIELGHGSDLDLVFIYEADAQAMSDGNRALDNRTYFTRLGQKLVHILNTQTFSGRLYEVDMRLRPSGQSGLLVSSLSAFEKYQRESAWVWEHQALTRARAIAGDVTLQTAFAELRKTILMLPRDRAALQGEVINMREKMRRHLGSGGSASQQFHLKQDAGGIVDIEFIVQFAVLAWAEQTPGLVAWTDNVRILESLQSTGYLSSEQVNQLREAYITFRSAGHLLTLQNSPAVVSADTFSAERAAVLDVWRALFGEHGSSSPGT